MSTKSAVTTAIVVAVLAGPAFGGDQDLATLLRDSGRYVPDANLPEWDARKVPARGYASARVMHVPPHAFASVVTPALHAPTLSNDFQLQGR